MSTIYYKFVLLHAGIKVKFIHLLMDCSLVLFFDIFHGIFSLQNPRSPETVQTRGNGAPVEIATQIVVLEPP